MKYKYFSCFFIVFFKTQIPMNPISIIKKSLKRKISTHQTPPTKNRKPYLQIQPSSSTLNQTKQQHNTRIQQTKPKLNTRLIRKTVIINLHSEFSLLTNYLLFLFTNLIILTCNYLEPNKTGVKSTLHTAFIKRNNRKY